MENPLISVIVPVYNTEPFLPKCLDSIIGQTYRNLQIILVDDGSPDRCGEICDEYAKRDNRICVIHQQNSGVTTARNVGLAPAKGEYLAFVDSDDWLELNMYEEMLQIVVADHTTDIVFCDFLEETENDTALTKISFHADEREMIKPLLQGSAGCILWNMLIKRSFYDSCNVRTFPNDRIFEDAFVLLQLLCDNPSLAYLGYPLYHHNRQNELSATAKCRTLANLYRVAIPTLIHIQDFLIDKGLFSSYKDSFNVWIARAKIAILKEEGIEAARKIFPSMHRPLIAFRSMNRLIAIFYWFGFNGRWLGAKMITLYLRILQRIKA